MEEEENQGRIRKRKNVKHRNTKRETSSSHEANGVQKPESSIATVNQRKSQKLIAMEEQGRSIKRKGVKHRNSAKCEANGANGVQKPESSMPTVNQHQGQIGKRKGVKLSKPETSSHEATDEVNKTESFVPSVNQPKPQKLLAIEDQGRSMKRKREKISSSHEADEVGKPESSMPTIADQGRSGQRKRVKHRNAKLETSSTQEANEVKRVESSIPPVNQLKTQKLPQSSSFLDKMRASLSGGHFRQINEKLYTCTGKEALVYFNDNSALFNVYHTGYQQQMSSWPELPVNIIIKWLKDHSPSMVVADFGCGDARLAKQVKNKVFSLDLVAEDPSVIACDMSNTPLASASVDVAVFCLSLMGTDFSSFIQEADRVLKPNGWLLIAEVKSRFDPTNGGADPAKFINAVCELGFSSVVKDFSNKMFILLYFKKKKNNLKKKEIEWPKLKACIYKKR